MQEGEPPNDNWDPDYKYDEGYFLGVKNTADQADALYGCCYKYMKEEHCWRDCPKLLKEELKATRE